MASFRPFALKGYSKFETVQSGANGTVKGRLPNEDDPEAFVYAKELIINVSGGLFVGTLSRTLTGQWHIQLLDAPNDKVLFEHVVTWKATIVALADPFFAGQIALITWSPAPAEPGGNPGAGAFQTTVIDTAPIQPEDAWKYVDFTNPTQFSEQGYTLFEPEGIFAIGDVVFQAVFVSPPYRNFVPAGAVLRIVSDHWGIGQISKGATYSFSFKEATPFLDASLDQFGALLHAYSAGGDAGAALGFEPFATLAPRGAVHDSRGASINVDKYGRVVLLVREPTGWFLHRSADGGRNFEKLPDLIWDKEIRMARAILDGDAVLTSAANGFDALFKRISPDSEISTLAGRLPKKEDVTPVLRNGKIYLIGQSGLLFSSTDKGANFKKEWVEEAPDDGAIIVSNA